MDAFLIMIRNVILFAALAVPGYLLVKCNMLRHEHSATLSKVLMYVGMPFLILSGTVNNLAVNGELLLRILVVALIGIAYTADIFLITKPLTALEREEKTRGMMRFCAVFSNNGFLGIPLAIAVFGRDSQIFTVLIVLNIITNVMMYTLGAYLVSGDKRSMGLKKAFLNPVLIAFVAGLALNLLKVKNYVPEIVTYSDHFSGIVTPISMTILGMKLATVKLQSLFTSRKCYYVCALKLVIFPAVIVSLLLALRTAFGSVFDSDVITGFFIAFCMPTAGLASTFADSHNGDTENAVVFTLGTTLLSILSIPVLFALLNLLL